MILRLPGAEASKLLQDGSMLDLDMEKLVRKKRRLANPKFLSGRRPLWQLFDGSQRIKNELSNRRRFDGYSQTWG
jgi:hypothetical protein